MPPVHLDIDSTSGIARLHFQRPEVLNAIDVTTARALRDQVQVLAGDARVRCVLLSGEGRAFVAGGDLAPFAQDFDRAPAISMTCWTPCIRPSTACARWMPR